MQGSTEAVLLLIDCSHSFWLCVCVPWHVCVGQRAAWGVDSLHHVGPRDLSQVIRRGAKHISPLSHLTKLKAVHLNLLFQIGQSQFLFF